MEGRRRIEEACDWLCTSKQLGVISKNLITREDIMGKNNYLIVGGNSFIGINLALGLLKQGQNKKYFLDI